MAFHLLHVGLKSPSWITQGCQEYQKRFPPAWAMHVQGVPTSRLPTAPQRIAQEGKALLTVMKPLNVQHWIALVPEGHMACERVWVHALEEHRHLGLVIGGPDGLDASLVHQCAQRWSLGPTTLPHGLARLLCAERLYRAYCHKHRLPYVGH